MKIKLQDFRDTFQTIHFTANYAGLVTSCGEKNVPLLLNLYVSIFIDSNKKRIDLGIHHAQLSKISESKSLCVAPKTSLFNV